MLSSKRERYLVQLFVNSLNAANTRPSRTESAEAPLPEVELKQCEENKLWDFAHPLLAKYDKMEGPAILMFAIHGSGTDATLATARAGGETLSHDNLIDFLYALSLSNQQPALICLFICYGGGKDGPRNDSLAAKIAEAAHPIPLLAYFDRLSFEDLAVGHPYLALRLVSTLYNGDTSPELGVDRPDTAPFRQYICTHPASQIDGAFELAVVVALLTQPQPESKVGDKSPALNRFVYYNHGGTPLSCWTS